MSLGSLGGAGVVEMEIRRQKTYLASKVFARVFPLHLFWPEQHRALAEYLPLFLDPAL